MEGQKILSQIIQKGGMLGACGNVLISDKEKTILFIKECADLCHSKMANDLWGSDLIRAIMKFTKSKSQRKARLNTFDKEITRLVKSLRESKGAKQGTLAFALDMSQGYYCKMESGLKPWTLSQLNIISKELNTTVIEMLTLVQDKNSFGAN